MGAAVQGMRKHARLRSGWYADVNMRNGQAVRAHAEALGAAWCGIEVGAGYIQDAAWCVNAHHRIRSELGFLPESFDVERWRVVNGGHLLRPELVESTYLVYAATRDPSWLAAGAHIVSSLQFLDHGCGFPCFEGTPGGKCMLVPPGVHDVPLVPVADVTERTLMDWTPSFYLGETLKYLYLCVPVLHVLEALQLS